ncbi:MAG: methyltransferase domain-containing protein [Clostridiales bacterium]|nr:methyltransferase domain-containing protein [Clostridiales bacterium]
MNRKFLFDKVASIYDKRRPGYGAQLYDDIFDYADISSNNSVIEVGCGTGKATEAFLKKNCNVTAVELGENLAFYTKWKFQMYPNLKVIQSAFEDYKCEEDSFDLLYSAGAFHWIPAEIGSGKANRIIKPGGSLALFWNIPSVNNPKNPLHREIISIYMKYLPQWGYKEIVKNIPTRHSKMQKRLMNCGFGDIKFKQYFDSRIMTGQEYVELLDTYPDHMDLVESIKKPMFAEIREAVERYGNELIVNEVVELYLARKVKDWVSTGTAMVDDEIGVAIDGAGEAFDFI